MYEYEVTFNWTGAGSTQRAIITTLDPISSNSWSKTIAPIIERQFGKKPANIYSYKLIKKK